MSLVRSCLPLAACVALCVVLSAVQARADHFTYRDQQQEKQEVDARLVATNQGVHLLELADGQYRIVPEGAVEQRTQGPDPEPLDADQIAARLQTEFGAELFRSYDEAPFVMGLVLGAPLPKSSDSRATNFLRRAAKFMKNVETAFVSFVKEARIPAKLPRHPLVVLIFETETDFEKYAQRITGGRGLSAGNISGFYSGLTNYLAIRMGECRTFDVPLHEAIHQQVYNRNVFQRLAPVPHWFDEGIATGFEGNQGKVNIGPTKISARYARQAMAAREVTWDQLLADDSAFSGDVLAGEAYGHAWGLHWLLVTKYKAQYGKYVRKLAEKQPLEKEAADQRVKDFKEIFGKDPAVMAREFKPALDAGIKRQKVVLNPEKQVGILLTHENMAEVELEAVKSGSRLAAGGKLTNISPLRSLCFHVTVETDSGTYAEWLVRDIDVNKTEMLTNQPVTKRMQNSSGGASERFRVRVKSAPADSPQAQEWKKGNLPVPVFGG